jgi:hypothetical protein
LEITVNRRVRIDERENINETAGRRPDGLKKQSGKVEPEVTPVIFM